MKRTFATALFCFAFTFPAFESEINIPALDFKGKTAEGKIIKLSDYKGKVVLLNFWASWCEPCKKELPFLAKLHEKLKPAGLEMITINIDIEVEKMQKFLSEQNVQPDFPVIYDEENSLPRLYDVEAMPTTVLIDKQGIIRYRQSDFKLSYMPKILGEIITLLQ